MSSPRESKTFQNKWGTRAIGTPRAVRRVFTKPATLVQVSPAPPVKLVGSAVPRMMPLVPVSEVADPYQAAMDRLRQEILDSVKDHGPTESPLGAASEIEKAEPSKPPEKKQPKAELAATVRHARIRDVENAVNDDCMTMDVVKTAG